MQQEQHKIMLNHGHKLVKPFSLWSFLKPILSCCATDLMFDNQNHMGQLKN